MAILYGCGDLNQSDTSASASALGGMNESNSAFVTRRGERKSPGNSSSYSLSGSSLRHASYSSSEASSPESSRSRFISEMLSRIVAQWDDPT
jgi:hypothetical protein